jgi:hypothetical protein
MAAEAEEALRRPSSKTAQKRRQLLLTQVNPDASSLPPRREPKEWPFRRTSNAQHSEGTLMS